MKNNKFSFVADEYDSDLNKNPDLTIIGQSKGSGSSKKGKSSSEHNAKLNKKREEKQKKSKEDSPLEKREVVMNGAKLKCPYAQASGELKVTSNEINLQDQLWATEGDGNNMINLQFKGICRHPKWSGQTPPPCMSVIKLSPWQNLGTSIVQEQRVLVKESFCVCNPMPNVAVPKPIPKVESIKIETKDNNIKDTYLLFLKESSKEPIFGLQVCIEVANGKIIKGETNSKGVFQISSKEKGPFKLFNTRHPKVTTLSEKERFQTLNYENCYTFHHYEKKDFDYIKNLKKASKQKTNKIIIPTANLEVESGDTLEHYIDSHFPSYNKAENKMKGLYDFNWKSPVKETYYNFDFGKEGKIFIPNFDYAINNLSNANTHVFYLTTLERKPLSQKILDDLKIVRRNIWSKQPMKNYDIINPKKNNSKRSKIEFDWGYHTIVLHNSGNKLTPTVTKLEEKHIKANGWEDLGYHYMIGRKEKGESNIYEGRPLIFKGSHAGKLNTKKIGILIEGDFELQTYDDDDEVEFEQIVLLKKLIKKLVNEIPSIKNLVGHSDVIGEDYEDNCPGEGLHKYFDQLRKEFNLSNKVI